ncbi:MAG: DUF4760 domain-containing protein [Mesorhizobium sp.]|uniref:DUF4760 domain-containing protein n=1 Tax=Mesorhizobium sp. M1E.F.Ca.ET.045.02.1.1 TaxID=2493672 RepID=UPI000F755935|nr:DUF4760 domain-containing protein [Mesorhizobium sp. M1E.F.Ca.ET.045.02.1.1]AZO22713.1 DUF4760 domain-containing protein [Mesorhizobium sp. M1E.F.Ca.ET.045.02.1.1]TIT98815.1 MAG: DUF4760 domain-containing protein [Mesorhizobium sp.]TJW81339.1 MAG: DUF4760 domain-containing protein [Mesorhizobium sp.]
MFETEGEISRSNRLTINSLSLYVMSSVLMLLGIFIFVAAISRHDKDLVTAASIFTAGAAAVFAVAAKFQADERDRAFRFLTENVNSKELMTSMHFVGRIINSNNDIDALLARNICVSRDTNDVALISKITYVYNFFEEMAIAVANKQVNERILRDYYVGTICRFTESTVVFLPIMRNFPEIIEGHPWVKRQRPDMFVNAIWLYVRWRPYYLEYFRDRIPAYDSRRWTGHS